MVLFTRAEIARISSSMHDLLKPCFAKRSHQLFISKDGFLSVISCLSFLLIVFHVLCSYSTGKGQWTKMRDKFLNASVDTFHTQYDFVLHVLIAVKIRITMILPCM
jgi:hypothetical protein